MIVVKNLWKRYGKLQVLKGLTLDIQDNETLVILGRSGTGKSVLLRQITGIEKPDQGYIDVNSYRVTHMDLRANIEVMRHIGMLFQGGALFDSMNIGQNVGFYLHQHYPKMPHQEIKDKVAHALELVGLSGIEEKMPSDLSGGMRKRAALARVIVYRPSVILYDEPTTGLDPITSMQISELINKTKEELKAISIVVTHDLRSALEVGDRLAFLHEGQIAHIAPKREFLRIEDPLIQSFFGDAIITPEMLGKISTKEKNYG